MKKENKIFVLIILTCFIVLISLWGVIGYIGYHDATNKYEPPVDNDISTVNNSNINNNTSKDTSSSSTNEENKKPESNSNSHLTYIGSSSDGKQYAINTNGMYYYSGDAMIIVLANSNGATQFIGASGEYYMVKGDLVKIGNGDLSYKGS